MIIDQASFDITTISVVHHPFPFSIIIWLLQLRWLDKDGEEIEKNEKKKNIEDNEEEVEGTKLHNAVSTIKLKVVGGIWIIHRDRYQRSI